MKKKLISILLSMIFIFSCFMTTATVLAEPEKGNGRVIVCLKGQGLKTRSVDRDLQWESLMKVTNSDTMNAESGVSARSFGVQIQEENESQTLFLVTSHSMDNDALINKLEARKDVLFAEADTYITLDENPGGSDTNGIAETDWSRYVEGTDLSKFQWHLNNEGNITDGKKSDGNAVNDVGNTRKLTGNEKTIVAVMDTGVDYTNPNLSDQMYTFNDEQMSALDCDEHGYCAANFKDNDIMDSFGHGTHCAGIIGASGLNGIHGVIDKSVQMIGVKIQDDDTGYIWMSSMIKGWNWLVKAKAAGVNVRAVNVSIGGYYVCRSEKMAVAAADAVGITTIFASANDSKNVDLVLTDVGEVSSGSVLNVNAIEASGKASSFTNYGKTQTDIYAPGSAMLSTAAGGVRTFNAFIAAQDPYRTVVYEGFEDMGSDDAIDPDVNGGLDFHYYDESKTDRCGDAVTVGNNYYSGAHGLDIPASGNETVTIISKPIEFPMMEINEQLYRGFCMWSESQRIEIKCDFMLKDGSFSDTTAENMGHYQWRNSGNSSNGHSDLQQMPENVDFENFQMKITITFTDTENILHLDSIGVGTGLDNYTVYGGTSMAAPAVTGAFALLASNHPTECSARISGRILGGAYDRDEFANTCVSGGQLNIDKADTDPDPAIQTAVTEGQTVTLKGWFIGSGGTVTIGGQPAEILSWKEDTDTTIGKITVRTPEGLTGAQMAVVTDTNGQSGSKQVLLPAFTDYSNLSVPQDAVYDEVGFAGLAALGEDIYLLGGNINTEETILWKYNVANDIWTNLGKTAMDPEEDNGFYGQITGHDGKLYATAYKTDPQTGSLQGSLWQYAPETKKWEKVKTLKDLPALATPVSYMGDLLLVGGEAYNAVNESMELSNKILKVDVATGAISTVGALSDGVELAQVAVSGDKLAVAAQYTSTMNPYFGLTDLETSESVALPTVDAGQQMDMALGSTAKGFILTGPVESADGIWTDTWYYDLADGNFYDAEKTLSSVKTYRNVGITVGNTFYVWGQSGKSEDISFFRKTTVPASYVLTPVVNNGDMGHINPNSPVTLMEGETQTFTATANAGYRIKEWKINGQVNYGKEKITVTADKDKAVEAVFEEEDRRVVAAPITIDAVAGQSIAECRAIISLTGDRFVNFYIGQDVTYLFATLPEGLTAVVCSVYDKQIAVTKMFASAGYAAESPTYLSGNTLEIAINGTPTDFGTFDMSMTIPGENLESGVSITGAHSGEMTINQVNPSDKPADYSKVDAAIEKAKALNADDYTNFDEVTKAINAVERNKKITEQTTVDGYATAIENAINGLVKKPITSPTTTQNTTSLTQTIPATTSPNTTSQVTDSPQTGDTGNMVLCFALLFISGGAVVVLGITKKRRKAK